jgi:hypothetical protein
MESKGPHEASGVTFANRAGLRGVDRASGVPGDKRGVECRRTFSGRPEELERAAKSTPRYDPGTIDR